MLAASVPTPSNFFSCDWGTSSLRLRLVTRDTGEVQSHLEVADGGVRQVAGSIPHTSSAAERARAFESALAQHLLNLPRAGPTIAAGAPIVISGMASSSIGWKELPYAQLPFPVDGSQARSAWVEMKLWERTLPVLLVSGLASNTEIMRGEETQLIGLLAQPRRAEYARDALIVLPGTHSKHLRVQDGHVTGLQTFMTGELYDVLCAQSVLRFTTQSEDLHIDEEAFLEGVGAAKASGFMRSLFQVRTRGVLSAKSGAANRAFLSGLLIGAEWCDALAGLDAPRILVAAPEAVGRLYQMGAACLDRSGRLELAGEQELAEAVVRGHALLLEGSV